ncbi:MAG: flagellar export protein FliJ [Candidatus Cloacimonetes bacterium]|jgi:flagellar export protein FliJ|nr:flagellar export protein FliJ [Candidatus Cloacimonadota bacterium]
MSPFRFRLQKLLELRQWSEKEKAAALASAQHAAAQAQEIRDAIMAARAAGLQQLASAHAGCGSAGELQRLHAVLAQLESHADYAREAALEAERIVDTAQQAFTEAAQARHALEQLRERRLHEWRTAATEAEQKQMDEIALQRHKGAETEKK